VQDLSVAAGDLDGDGKAEVVVALIDNVEYMEVISLDDLVEKGFDRLIASNDLVKVLVRVGG
jgi:hypothetical protein